MARTNRTNPHSEEPIRRSNRTAGKSPARVVPACKPAAAHKATSLARKDTAAREETAAHEATSSARKDTAARKDSAAPHGGSEKFSGERKGPPEAIVPAPVAHKDTASHGGSEKFIGERKGPPEAIVPAPEAIVPRLPTLREWTPSSGVDILPVKPYFEPIIPKLFLETRAPAPGDSSGSMHWNCI